MAAFLLIHGAWHDERCWDLVVPELAARGHAVHTLTLPGHWNRPLRSYQISQKRYGEAICQAANQIGEPVTLVGHSMGGMAISKAAEMQPCLFDELIYLTAYLPRLNKWTRMRSLALSDHQTQLWSAVRTNWLRFRAHLKPELVGDVFYHDCPPDVTEQAISRLGSQSGLPIVEFSRITERGAASRPMTYIECLQDRVISPGLQKQMQSHAPFKQILSLDSSHSPFLSQPTQLADMLHGIVGGRVSTREDQTPQDAISTSRKVTLNAPLAEAKAG
jgi:pimeloyl-ACP methyl ester carboxylesterase